MLVLLMLKTCTVGEWTVVATLVVVDVVVVTVLATVDTTLVFEVPNDGRKVVGQSQSRAIATLVLRAMAEIDKIATTTKNS